MIMLPKLLWIDGGAGLTAGLIVLPLSAWLAKWYGLPHGVVLANCAANLLYASYSLSLASRQRRPRPLITFLAMANLSWAVVCLTLVGLQRETITVFGMIHLIGEALFVSVLAYFEWHWRDLLLTASSSDR